MSTHSVDVLECPPVEKHPNADTLGLIRIGGYTAAVRLGDFKEGDLIAYIEPDYVVPQTEQFAFLRDRRIRAKRLRGLWSQGLVIKAPEGSKPGDNVMEQLGIVRYEPPRDRFHGMPGTKGPPVGVAENVPADIASLPKYDLENWRKYNTVFRQGEPVVITEKLHGSNGRFCWMDGQLWCGSRSYWRQAEPVNYWHEVAKQNPWIEERCRWYEGLVIYGEVLGMQDLQYGFSMAKLGFRVFDVYRPIMREFVGAKDLMNWFAPEHLVPVLYEGSYDSRAVEALAELDSTFGGIGEGVVIKSAEERFAPELGHRAALKCVSNRYLERAP